MAGTHEQGTEGHDRAPVNEHGLTDSKQNGNGQDRNQFGLQDGLHPLQELDTHQTTQSQKEEKETQEREHAEQQKFYDQYRNPIAKFRAQYPQAPAEFLAVSMLSEALKTVLTCSRLSYISSWGYLPIFPLRRLRSKRATLKRKHGHGALRLQWAFT
jgi:hypothetical protein